MPVIEAGGEPSTHSGKRRPPTHGLYGGGPCRNLAMSGRGIRCEPTESGLDRRRRWRSESHDPVAADEGSKKAKRTHKDGEAEIPWAAQWDGGEERGWRRPRFSQSLSWNSCGA